jgi:hypothetical protein
MLLVVDGIDAGMDADCCHIRSPRINNGLAKSSLLASFGGLVSVLATPHANFLKRKSTFCVSEIAIRL